MIDQPENHLPVTLELQENIAIITIDNPPVNAMAHAVRCGLRDCLNQLDQTSPAGVLIRCSGKTFVAGADIREFDRPPMEPSLPELLDRLEALPIPILAELHGSVFGGGLELALACHYRIARPGTRLAFPEINLGLLPGAGGTQRAPKLMGSLSAMELMLSGKPISAQQAREQGLINEVTDIDAISWLKQRLFDNGTQRKSAPGKNAAVPKLEPQQTKAFELKRQQLLKKKPWDKASQYIVDCVELSLQCEYDDGQTKARELFVELAGSDESRALRHLFFAERQAASVKNIAAGKARDDISQVSIIGAGTMGTGIAMCFASAGIAVNLIETSEKSLQKGLEKIRENYQRSVDRNRISGQTMDVCLQKIKGSIQLTDAALSDLVIEAVFENLDVKQALFEKLDTICQPDTILATNTSYQDVNKMAAVTSRPENVLGLHFFSPANIMKLLEVVQGSETSDKTLATAMFLARKIGKIPVISGVCYGFIGNRMLLPYALEAQTLLLEGAMPEQIDSAMEHWGMAMGPLAVADLAGLDIGYKARKARKLSSEESAGFRVADLLVEMGRLGQKTGAGFYRYTSGSGKRIVDESVCELIETVAGYMGISRRTISDSEIVERLLNALISEGADLLEEGIARRASDIDVVFCNGYGFPRHRGGPMYHAEVLKNKKAEAL